jgi:diguanylate cyclase (GGDEF)-like protein
MIGDFFWTYLQSRPGTSAYYLLHIALFVYYFSTALSYYLVLIFLDYFACRDKQRLHYIIVGAALLNIFNLMVLIVNIWTPLYFSILPGSNSFERGPAYILRVVICYLPIVIGMADALSAPHVFRKTQVSLLLLFTAFVAAGSSLDLLLGDTLLYWPCFTAAIVFIYFFIIRRDARIDPLTGLGNRYSFNEFTSRMARLEARQVRPAEVWSIMMIDMDHFKEINDTLGHAEGDRALQDMASVIQANVEQGDIAVRYGGDEFVIACPGKSTVFSLINKIRAGLEELNAEHIRPYRLQMSCGGGVYCSDGSQTIQAFMEEVDKKMYQDKYERELQHGERRRTKR